jgi:hypothetical protein
MMDRTFFGGMLRAAAVAAMATIVLAGCRTNKEVPGDPFQPTDGPALVKLGPGDTMPDVTAAYARKSFYLERAADESIGWFQKPSSKQWFPFKNQGTAEEVCTHDQAAASVVAFRDLMMNSPNAQEFSARFFEMFDVWQSVGYTKDRDVMFTGYYSPIFHASREATDRFRFPLYTRPADLVSDPATGQPLGRPRLPQRPNRQEHAEQGDHGHGPESPAPKPPQPIPGMSGTSWLAVEQTSTLPPLCTQSQAQPEPKRVTPALENSSLNFSKLPNASSIATASAPVGTLEPPGVMISQNKLWL